MNITGESESAYVFGLSYSTGLMATSFAIARVEGSGQLYADALENLWANFESEYGSVTNQKLALQLLHTPISPCCRIISRPLIIEFY